MKLERLHIFSDEDWEQISNQFNGFFAETFEFVTENKGSLAEARDIYVNSFLYYTQLLELHGMGLQGKGADIVYSFTRCLWIKKLRKRKVDTNFVTHRREFFEMEDAFHEIDSIAERSTKTADKLAEVGEPSRTLILDYIGKGLCLSEIGQRLGFTDEDRAQQTVVKSLRKLIILTEGVDFQMDDTSFELALRYTLDTELELESAKSDKVSLAMISRTVAMIKNYVTRNKRLEVFKDLEIHFEPKLPEKIEHKHNAVARKNQKMKPAALIITTAMVALVVSALTAFSWMELSSNIAQQPNQLAPVEEKDTVAETSIPEVPQINYTAFAINSEGYLVTTADAVRNKTSVRLEGNGSNRNLKADVLMTDTLSNLALLKCAFEQGTRLPYRFSPENPELGQSVYTLGFPHENMFYAIAEINASVNENKGEVKMDDFLPGSPIISENGQLLGIVTNRNETDMMSQVTYISVLKDFVSLAEEKGLGNVTLQNRNRLYTSNRIAQIDGYTPFLWKVNN
jgi:hypothetical protein